MQADIRVVDTYGSMLKTIEAAGRTCWDSTSKIDDDSAEKFVTGIVRRGHESVIEHSRQILSIPYTMCYEAGIWIALSDAEVQMSVDEEDGRTYLSSNFRGWRDLVRYIQESGLPWIPNSNTLDCLIAHQYSANIAGVLGNFLPALSEGFMEAGNLRFPEKHRAPRIGLRRNGIEVYPLNSLVPDLPEEHAVWHGAMTLRIRGISRIISHEWVRHRKTHSYSQRSQRYVKEAIPSYVVPASMLSEDGAPPAGYVKAMGGAWETYGELCGEYRKQDARYVLPGACTTELIVTATWRWWRHFLTLRTDEAALPEMRTVAKLVGELASVEYPSAFGEFARPGGECCEEAA